METETETPAWIAPGTPVLVISGRDGEYLTRTTIAKVFKRYFLVESRYYADARFSLDRQVHRMTGSFTVNPFAIPLDSDRARELLDVERRRILVNRARMLARDWQRDPSRDNRLALIVALQAVEDGE